MGCTCTTWQYVIQRKSPGFVFNSSGLMSKFKLYHIEKMLSDRGNPSIHVISRGVSPKISFLLWFIMMACFHEHLAREVWKLVRWVKKPCRFQIWQSICSESNSWLWTFNGIHQKVYCATKTVLGAFMIVSFLVKNKPGKKYNGQEMSDYITIWIQTEPTLFPRYRNICKAPQICIFHWIGLIIE